MPTGVVLTVVTICPKLEEDESAWGRPYCARLKRLKNSLRNWSWTRLGQRDLLGQAQVGLPQIGTARDIAWSIAVAPPVTGVNAAGLIHSLIFFPPVA